MLDPFVLLAPVLVLPIVGLLRFIGCQSFGSTDASPTATSSPVTVSLDKTSASVCPGKSMTFTATVQNDSSGKGVTWSVSGAGTQMNSGTTAPYTCTYTAPDPFMAGTVTITAASNADNTKSASATVTLIPNSATAVFRTPPNRPDTTTQGNWRGTYGNKGWALAGDTSQPGNADLVHLPTFLPEFVGPPGTRVLESPINDADARLPEKPHLTPPPADFSHRWSTCWNDFANVALTVVFDFNDSDPHMVSLYFCDWVQVHRKQHIDVKDGAAVLDSTDITNFNAGAWLQWTVQGKITMVVTQTAADPGNEVQMLGVFFD